MIGIKTEREIGLMRETGLVVAEVLDRVCDEARAGVRLSELEDIGAEIIRKAGATSSFVGYQPSWAPTPYPTTLCLSVNDVIVHGIPDETVLRDGDILSVDCAVAIGGFHADAARTVPVGTADAASLALIAATERALADAIAACVAGGRLGDVSHAVERVGRAAGYGIPEYMGGHGIGTAMHEDPFVPNTGRHGRGLRLRPGMALALEPMFTAGGRDDRRTLADGWSEATTDGSRASHSEHSVAITEDGPVILTAS